GYKPEPADWGFFISLPLPFVILNLFQDLAFEFVGCDFRQALPNSKRWWAKPTLRTTSYAGTLHTLAKNPPTFSAVPNDFAPSFEPSCIAFAISSASLITQAFLFFTQPAKKLIFRNATNRHLMVKW
ncbi:MAG: hypothetical protein KAT46_02165, partial [Deltaproteobacteria bacterium]|nr:hypothetical protein [Deltaproteobacteria bacterium]